MVGAENSALRTIVSQNIDRGISVFLFGAVHQLMLSAPTPQLACLALLELAMIVKRVKFRECFAHKLLLCVSIFNGVIRLYFQITTLLYTFLGAERVILNEKYHSILILLIVAKIAIEVLANVLYKIKKSIIKIS